jgi:hypothetical protein
MHRKTQNKEAEMLTATELNQRTKESIEEAKIKKLEEYEANKEQALACIREGIYPLLLQASGNGLFSCVVSLKQDMLPSRGSYELEQNILYQLSKLGYRCSLDQWGRTVISWSVISWKGAPGLKVGAECAIYPSPPMEFREGKTLSNIKHTDHYPHPKPPPPKPPKSGVDKTAKPATSPIRYSGDICPICETNCS